MEKWTDLKIHQKIFEAIFGGCLGCKYKDIKHDMKKSIIHINSSPKSNSPIIREGRRNKGGVNKYQRIPKPNIKPTSLIPLLLLLVSCSTTPEHGGWKDSDERVWSYMASFEKNYGKEIPRNTFFKFKEFDRKKRSSSAYCILASGKMYMDEPTWDEKDDFSRENLVYHELGHCILGLRHASTHHLKDDECPSSMMHWQGAAINGCYMEDRSYYIKELFLRANFKGNKYYKRKKGGYYRYGEKYSE